MKQIHHYSTNTDNQPTKLEWAVFAVALAAAVGMVALLIMSGCSTGTLPGQTKTEAKLDNNQAKQLSLAAAAVDAARMANAANPEGLPKTATGGELNVADANLPPAFAVDTQAAQARVNAALAGKLAETRKNWAEAVVQGEALSAKIANLEKQVTVERATVAEEREKANERLCILAALMVGGALSAVGALSLAAGLYFSLPKLVLGSAGLGLGGVTAFFAATQVGTVRFDWLAMIVVLGGIGIIIYTVWHGFAGGSVLKTKASGFESAMSAVSKWAGEIATGAETDAKQLWQWLGQELDAAHKALAADWQKLEAKFAAKPPSNPTA